MPFDSHPVSRPSYVGRFIFIWLGLGVGLPIVVFWLLVAAFAF